MTTTTTNTIAAPIVSLDSNEIDTHISASSISLDDKIATYLRQKAASYGIPMLTIKLTGSREHVVEAWAPSNPERSIYSMEIGYGDTVDEAVAALRKKIKTPQEQAKELMDKAEALMKEAKSLQASAIKISG